MLTNKYPEYLISLAWCYSKLYLDEIFSCLTSKYDELLCNGARLNWCKIMLRNEAGHIWCNTKAQQVHDRHDQNCNFLWILKAVMRIIKISSELKWWKNRLWWPSSLRQHAISQLIVATEGPRFESRSGLWYRLFRVRNGLSLFK